MASDAWDSAKVQAVIAQQIETSRHLAAQVSIDEAAQSRWYWRAAPIAIALLFVA